MIQAFKVAALALLLTACATAPEARRARSFVANPTALIAAELAFAKLAQDKGQWTAFRATAAPGAEMFVPQRTPASTFLKGRADPAKAVTWQPHAVWMSCDGSYGITRGAVQGPNGPGYFSTVWQRQSNGEYKWILDQGDSLDQPLPTPEMIAAKVASCSGTAAPVALSLPTQGDVSAGKSRDGTLVWVTGVAPDGPREFLVQSWNGSGFDEVLRTIAAPPSPAG